MFTNEPTLKAECKAYTYFCGCYLMIAGTLSYEIAAVSCRHLDETNIVTFIEIQ